MGFWYDKNESATFVDTLHVLFRRMKMQIVLVHRNMNAQSWLHMRHRPPHLTEVLQASNFRAKETRLSHQTFFTAHVVANIWFQLDLNSKISIEKILTKVIFHKNLTKINLPLVRSRSSLS
jgi:hypothetical protein